MSLRAAAGAARRPVIIEPRRGPLAFNFGELWEYRELLIYLAWREVRVRYKQSVLGIAWMLLQPLAAMTIFSVVFGRFAHLPSEGMPYPLFVLAGLLPWQLFASSLTRSAGSLVGNANLLTKVYFPRLIIPLSAALAGLVDFTISLVLLVGALIYFGVRPGWQIVTLPFFALLALLAAISLGLWLSALNVRYRDVQVALPFIVQIWLFASPVTYSASLVPGGASRLIYELNPMASIIQGFRWSLAGGTPPGLQLLGSTALLLAILIGGLIYFRSAEKTFADVV
ncbi:MAG TPA: ABC transporter permease [Candidatus Sulfotelmatobacter sp.]|nr:ABC transporter permease [Candidatus Sulfotelmatobacter sp.]